MHIGSGSKVANWIRVLHEHIVLYLQLYGLACTIISIYFSNKGLHQGMNVVGECKINSSHLLKYTNGLPMLNWVFHTCASCVVHNGSRTQTSIQVHVMCTTKGSIARHQWKWI